MRLDTAVPEWVPVGRGTAFFCNGACFHPDRDVCRGWLRVGGEPVEPAIWGAPRLDLVRALGNPRAYRSGFWGTIPIPAQPAAGKLAIELAVEFESGEEVVRRLGVIDVVTPPTSAARRSSASIAICMATHEPDPGLLRRQIDSLRAQTEKDWVCLIRDDCSSVRRFAELTSMIAGDERFRISRGERILGPYRNFERLLSHLPAGPSLVALCDQDDRWDPDKLAVLRQHLDRAQLAYCDQRIVDRGGGLRRETMWNSRSNQYSGLASLLIANTVTGAASLMRREVVELALPFPEIPGLALHDHWLALVALATGRIRYVDRPLGDYVQHGNAVLGQVSGANPHSRADARATYFYGFVPREVLARALLARCGDRLPPRKRRALQLVLASARSPLAFAWFLLRGILHRRVTLGTELELARGIAWRALIPIRAWRRQAGGRNHFDASCPAPTAETLGMGRLARWRATL